MYQVARDEYDLMSNFECTFSSLNFRSDLSSPGLFGDYFFASLTDSSTRPNLEKTSVLILVNYKVNI